MGFLGWTILGALIAVGTLKAYDWLKANDYKLKWYEVLLVALGILTLVFAIETYVHSRLEFEYKAANLSILTMGFPAILLLAAAFGSINRNNKKANKGIQNKEISA